jgi:Peptidase family M23
MTGPAAVALGATVAQGQIIGYVGSTGNSMGPHLHFDLWANKKIREDSIVWKPAAGFWAVDPLIYLGQELPWKEVQDDMTVVLAYPNYGGRWVLVDGYWKHPLGFAAFQALTAAKQVTLVTLPKATIDAIPNSA